MIEGMANEGNFLNKIDRSNGDFRENDPVLILSMYIFLFTFHFELILKRTLIK